MENNPVGLEVLENDFYQDEMYLSLSSSDKRIIDEIDRLTKELSKEAREYMRFFLYARRNTLSL